MILKTLGGYSSNNKLIYEEGNCILYNKNGTYTVDYTGSHIINASCSVWMKPEKTSDGVEIQIIVNGNIEQSREIKTGSIDFSEYPGNITSFLPLKYGDKIELYCKTTREGYISADSSKNTLTISKI